ncbi:hypothetical protein E2562_004812 [Oryza meyeriana var. granulata]|uniref:DUF834 domain-containing protein n=1 Tax=Oryza meyeriana var. granulata TaxID=110450 RepID=A0A6G1DEH7_9ORYZ|nr:hypothetical protein E2562_004812 [Oryza meyeriana var. granulata]
MAAATTSDGYGLWRPGRGAAEGWQRRPAEASDGGVGGKAGAPAMAAAGWRQRQAMVRRRRGFGQAGKTREGS